jgi:hypothetical protein
LHEARCVSCGKRDHVDGDVRTNLRDGGGQRRGVSPITQELARPARSGIVCLATMQERDFVVAFEQLLDH